MHAAYLEVLATNMRPNNQKIDLAGTMCSMCSFPTISSMSDPWRPKQRKIPLKQFQQGHPHLFRGAEPSQEKQKEVWTTALFNLDLKLKTKGPEHPPGPSKIGGFWGVPLTIHRCGSLERKRHPTHPKPPTLKGPGIHLKPE